MLDWLTGSGRTSQSAGSGRDVTEVDEPPQTPAPVFAVRAFKTAIFGTPQGIQEKDVAAQQRDRKTITGRNNPKTDKVALDGVTTADPPPLSRAVSNAKQSDFGEGNGPASPLKPSGIMLTPGAGRSRRKTVSFGASVLDNEGKRSVWTRKAELQDESSTASSHLQKSHAEAATAGSGRTRLTETLYESRNQVHEEDDGENRPSQHSLSMKSAQIPAASDAEEHDITVDMDNPRSTSGRYWKSELENYQEEAEQAIVKLKKYRLLAKAYTREKDSEAMSLSAKLHDESQKVKRLEAEVSRLITCLSSVHGLGGAHGSEQAQQAEMLASQTRLALEYKRENDRLQAAIEKDGSAASGENDLTIYGTSPRTAETLQIIRQELKKARKQVPELNGLRAETTELRGKVKEAEQRAEKLEEENMSLTKELARTREKLIKEMERHHRRKSAYKESGDRNYVSETIEVEGKAGRETFKVDRAMSSTEGTPTSRPHKVKHGLRGVSLPPDRAAAAMARLEQRKAERKKLRMQEREEDFVKV